MPAHDDELLSTLRFCHSVADGSIAPVWDDAREAELQGDFEVGLTIDKRYLLQSKLGHGSMGRVFLAKDLRLDRHVAIKVVLHPRHESLNLTLEREAKLGASLNHRGIATVYDYGFHDNKSYTVFEYVEGETLRQVIRRRGRLQLEEAVQITSDLAAALDFAHLQGVVHRDLKPENICFTKSGEFKILDLGLAYDLKGAAGTDAYSGTPAYSSPEQAKCRSTDGKSDQYALGLVVFEMLTGSKAFFDADPHALLRKQIFAEPPEPREFVPELPESAAQAILRSLSKNPDHRYATCQEFVRELGGGRMTSASRHVLPMPQQDRIGFYIGHVAEESLLARQLAQHLEPLGYVCWFYGRDAIAGVPFASQATAAIKRSEAIILLISRSALHSADLEREIEQAHSTSCPILPLLVDVSREEFEKLAPSWRRMLGASPILEYRRTRPLAEIVDRLAASAQALRIGRHELSPRYPHDLLDRCSGQIWATDANQIDILDLGRVLFRTETINDFLQGKHRHFISATKGFGKTLLLTCKRQLLTQAGSSATLQLTTIPEGRPYLDFMSEMRSLSEKYEKPLSELSNTKRLWSAALRISAISHHPAVIDAGEAGETQEFPERLRRWLAGVKVQPTVVFKELTSLRVSELNRLIDTTENFLDQKMRQIHGGTCFFIDKVDQAIRHLSRDAWIAIQAGLIEAAWEMMNANSHLKVFASIRQEAFTNYQSDIKSNLFSATTILNYSEEELQALLDQLAHCYEGCGTFADFLGLNVIRHGRRPAPEDSFQYVRRHTCGRPRDLVALASAISSQRTSLTERRLRELVQQTTSSVLVSNVFEEVGVFLNCLSDRDARARFLAEIPSNILEHAEAVAVCEQFNGLAPGTLQHFGEDSGDIYHPFHDLYFAGLLGVVERDPESGITLQRFRKPHDSLAQAAAELPTSPIYLVHPALDTFIRSQRTRKPFLQFQHIAVGEDCVWEHYYPTLVQIEKQLQVVSNQRLAEVAHQVVKQIQSALNTGKTAFARADIRSTEEWKFLSTNSNEGSGDLMFWLEELANEL
jgi:predicted Ser/Thr protein kinase